jgi:outer membrane protein OmpU
LRCAFEIKHEGKTMKKVLFATTALIATAGVASADIAMSGSAEFGTASEDGANSNIYSNANIKFTMSGVTDGGVEFGTSLNASAGAVDYDPGDWEFDAAETGAFGLGAIYVSFNGMKLSADNNDIDNLYDDDKTHHDVRFDYAQGPLSFAVTYNGDAQAVGDADYSFTASVTQMGFTLSVTGDDGDENRATKIAYAIAPFDFSVEVDQKGAAASETTVAAGYTEGPLSLSAESVTADGADAAWEFGVTYTIDALTIGAVADSVTDDNEVTASYNLGGGASVIGGVKGDESYYVGLSMSF